MSLSASPTVCRSRVSRTCLLALEPLGQPALLVVRQPLGVLGAVVQVHSSTNTLATIAGIASIRNSHCQSSRPPTPPNTDMIPPEIGAPMA